MNLLLPREHGAYGQLLVPLVTALFVFGRPSLPSGLLVLSAILLFWSHEPMLVILGQRGTRPRRELGRRAGLLLPLLSLGSLLGMLLALRDQPGLLWSLLLPLGLGLAVLPPMLLHKEKTTLAELLVALALSSWAVPVQQSKGVPLHVALLLWGSLALVFCVAVLSVRGLMKKLPLAYSVALSLLGLGVSLGLSEKGVLPPQSYVPQLPSLALAVGLWAVRPGPRYLRQVGWAIVSVSLLVITLLVLSR